MKIHVLVEGKSEKELIERWGCRAFPQHTLVAHPHQGKGDLPKGPRGKPNPKRRGLLDLLPVTLRAFGESAARDDEGVLVLVDTDDERCTALKARIAAATKKLPRLPRVVFRIAVEETEAFYLGDLRGLQAAFPDADMKKAREYLPDSICGTAELFGEIVDDGGLNKVAWAEVMGEHLTTSPARSRSPSFKALHAGVSKLIAMEHPAQEPRRKKHWKARHPRLRKRRQVVHSPTARRSDHRPPPDQGAGRMGAWGQRW